MKKTGHFFFAFIPLILALGLEHMTLLFSKGISALTELVWYTASKTADIRQILADLENLWRTPVFHICAMICYALVAAAVFGLWYYMRYNGDYLPRIRSTFPPAALLGTAMLVPGTQFLGSYITSFASALFPGWVKAYAKLSESRASGSEAAVLLFVYSVLLCSVFEELVFRGVTLRQLETCLPFWAANLIQALLFGIFHLNMLQGVCAFCLGLILGYVCKKGGSIYYPVLLHLFYNFWGTMISRYIDIGSSTFTFLFWFLFALVMTAGGLAVFTSGIRKCQDRLRPQAGEEESP